MGIFDMFKFWKKTDEFDLGSDLSFDTGAKPDFGPTPNFSKASEAVPHSFGNSETKEPSFSASPFGTPSFPSQSSQTNSFGQSSPFASSPQSTASSADLQLISAKLDTIRVMLENLSARLQHLEQRQDSDSGVQLVQGRSQPQVKWNY